MIKLFFAKGNAKLGKDTAIFSLPAGHTCAGAKDCLALAARDTGKITDGANSQFRCYATTAENLFPNIRKSRWNNYDALKGKTIPEMTALLLESLPKNISLVRVHQSGDFFSYDYFLAWLGVASKLPQITFYGYTKMLPFLVMGKNVIPSNLHLVASVGGKFDNLIAKHNLQSATVVFSKAEAKAKGLKIDHDDTLVWKQRKSFAILLHGTQPAGSVAGKAWQLIKKTVGGYKADYFKHYKNKKKVLTTSQK